MIDYLRNHVWAVLPKKITRKQCIREAFIWGGALMLLGWFMHWRGKIEDGTMWVLIGAGAALAVALLIPGLGERVYLTILRFFAIIGYVVARVVLTLMFYIVVTPLGWVLRLMGKDLLDEKFRSGAPPQWKPHGGKTQAQRYYRLF